LTNNPDSFIAVVPDIPLQSWVNITVNVHDKALDLYINGKLTQSNLVPYIPAPVNGLINLTPAPGFLGWTSNLQYYAYSMNPQQVYNLYTAGYKGGTEGILSLLGKYSMKVIFVNNSQQSSVST
jgi:hypothetical protein